MGQAEKLIIGHRPIRDRKGLRNLRPSQISVRVDMADITSCRKLQEVRLRLIDGKNNPGEALGNLWLDYLMDLIRKIRGGVDVPHGITASISSGVSQEGPRLLFFSFVAVVVIYHLSEIEKASR